MNKRLDAHFQTGLRLHSAGRLAEAEQVYRSVLAAFPRHADSLHMLGVVATQCGQPQAGLGCIDAAIAIKPSAAMFHVNRAAALLALRQLDAALAACQQATRLKRNCAEAYQVMGHVLSDQGRPNDAILAYRDALRYKPGLNEGQNDLALALREANRLAEAAEILTAAAKLKPHDVHVTGNLAGVLKDLGRLDEAEGLYRDILRRYPDDPTAHYNLGVLLLTAGRFCEAWKEWEWRFRADPTIAGKYAQPRWSGEALNGRTLLVHGEQGIGDMLQFCRFLPLVARGGRVVVEVHQPIARLLSRLPGVSDVVALGSALPPVDLQCPMMSLPFLLGAKSERDIPRDVPYLRADSELAEHWRRRLASLSGVRVGVVWAGNPERMRMDRRRSIAPERLAPLADMPGVTLVSLQKAGPSAPPELRLHDWTDELGDFADTAALVQALDLVIGVDTAVVHLAGALGKPVWLLNRSDTCWRWLRDRDDSPWYPTLRQFRQNSPGDWDGVIEEVSSALKDFAQQRPGDR